MSYGCSSSAGPSTQHFWKRLVSTPITSEVTQNRSFPNKKPSSSVLELLTKNLMIAWRDCLGKLDPKVVSEVRASRRVGVILASTKGCVDDFVWDMAWDPVKKGTLKTDTITPVLEAFLKVSEIDSEETICISNACASSLSAVFLAREWLAQDRVDYVLVLAADYVGDFVTKGFGSLKALTQTTCKPFSFDRDGLWLGDAATAILLTHKTIAGFEFEFEFEFEIEGISTNTEGYAVTKPDQSGESLRRVCQDVMIQAPNPDLIIAHGTGTQINDLVEDSVFYSLFGRETPVTCTKWSIGHTLGASASMDIIAACEALKRKHLFRIETTQTIDLAFKARYLTPDAEFSGLAPFYGKSILVTSLGFGGIHSAILIRKQSEK